MASTRETLSAVARYGALADATYAAGYFITQGPKFQTPFEAISHLINNTATYETYNTLAIEGGALLSGIALLALLISKRTNV